MGAILGKSKSVPNLEKVNGHEKEVMMNSNNHIDGTTTLGKKIKKKKERISNRKSLDLKVDKYTSTDGSVISSSSSSYIKQLVNGSGYNNVSYDDQINLINQSEIPSKDVLELRDACIRRGIISPEMNTVTLRNSIEQDHQENTTNILEESTNETVTTVVTNNEQQVES
jgi:hypothetical protein